MEQDTNGNARFTYSVTAQRDARIEQRVKQRASIARLADAYRHPMALADALESRTDALSLSTLDQDQRIVARDGYYTDAEMLADAWLTLSDETHEPAYHGVFHAAPAEAPVHTCQTRAEWAQVWDEAAEAGSAITRQWHARQMRASLVSESRADAIRDLMGATSTYVADWSDGLRISDVTNVARNHRVKRNRAQYVERSSDTEPDALYGRWRESDRTQSPTVWRNGRVASGIDGRQRERDAIKAAARITRLAQMRAVNNARRNDSHALNASAIDALARVRIGTSER